MAKWDYKIDVKQYLSADDSVSSVQIASKGVVCELKKLPTRYQDAVEEFIYNFEELAEDSEADCDYFNDLLNDLYDWADDYRVWLGL